MFFKKKKTYQKASEEELIKGCLNNERLAQSELYERFCKTMYSTCMGYAKDEELAQELLQEGFLKVFANISKYSGSGSLEGWIRRVIINTCIDYVRKSNPKFVTIDLKDFYSFKLKYYETNLIEYAQEKDYFLFLIQHLAVGYRTILNMYYVEEMTHQEIAKELDISVGTSKSQLSRGRFLLKKHLQEELEKEKEVAYGA
jgi:RNA polymerase sigma factor (sigma-70 family)